MSNTRKKFSADEKVWILKEHFVSKMSISDICDKHGLHPTVFYRWQKEFFENGALIFQKRTDKADKKLARENAELKARLSHKDEVIAEIMESHVALKKSLGVS